MSNGDYTASARSYEMHQNPPPHMTWEEYEQKVIAEWNSLLNSPECNEKLVHQFLVKHPSMVPGAFSVTGPSGHSPFPRAVLSESPLSGVGMRVPDFIWLAKDSGNLTPVFIEIESPRKRWFTKHDVPTSDLSQAMNQLAQWQAWLNQSENVAVFCRGFEIPEYLIRHHTFRPEFVLIYGRRKEFDDRPQLRRLRAQFEKHGQVVMTFDRLYPARDCSNYISATKNNGGYRALAVPATLEIGPHVAEDFAQIARFSKAIQENKWMSENRRHFLVERLPYWNKWARIPAWERGVIGGGDWE